MASLGSFGAATREYQANDRELDTFELCGETFTVHGEIPAIVELSVAAALVDKVSGIEGDASLYEALRHALTIGERRDGDEVIPADEAEWWRFLRHATERHAEAEWLTTIVLRIMAAQVGRPTERRPTSSSGPSPTSTGSSSSASDFPVLPG